MSRIYTCTSIPIRELTHQASAYDLGYLMSEAAAAAASKDLDINRFVAGFIAAGNSADTLAEGLLVLAERIKESDLK